MTNRLLFFCSVIPLLCLLQNVPAGAFSGDPQAVPHVRSAVESYLRRETAGLPGTVSFAIGAVDPRLNLPACVRLESFVPAGARLWGQTFVGVRCNGAQPWIIYVPVEIRVAADIVHSARPLLQNQPIGAADLLVQKADLTQLPPGVLTDLNHAIGKTLTRNLAGGQPLRDDMLRAPSVIQQGQPVKLLVQGRGFSVSAGGRALAAAADGQAVQVRVQSGQIVSGIARHGGVVEMRP